MREITKLDKILLVLGFFIVIAIFTLAYIIYAKGGQCTISPCAYATLNNISCSSQPYFSYYSPLR